MNSKVNKKLRKNKKTINKSSNKRNLKMKKISRKKKQSGGDNPFQVFAFKPLSPRSPTTSPKEPMSSENNQRVQASTPHLYKSKGKRIAPLKNFNTNPSFWRRLKAQFKNKKNYRKTKQKVNNFQRQQRFREYDSRDWD